MKGNNFKEGESVAYKNFDGTYENGVIKSLQGPNHVFVVFNCDGEWHRYKEFTAQRVAVSDLVHGWRG